ncbi:glycosyltransferase family 92 protein [Rufibacter sediminis]|uniref:Glycosyltransferase family 92 protein n=1 Tax=Rufibacter sediminis TaxID=2762756 RepID=A0ABR6VNL9_9BACT|nr:glycosyltransferase family 92 protein [Rufibacter sediminis]MBC3538721.1 glycosyltransferase family 92 protein [Rufibacter sediminis]
MKNFLSLVIIVKDEDAYLKEFIEYYRMLGVDHFYFYDNDSAVPVKSILKEYDNKTVTINKIVGKAKQMEAYKHFLFYYGKDSRWAGFIDLDEFIVPKTTYSLTEFLKDYEYADALGVNWVLFGHNDHEIKPAGLVTENYIKREFRQNVHIKSIVNPRKALYAANPHFIVMKDGSHYVDAKHSPITSAFNENHTIDVVQMNHYFTKSAEEFIKKARRGRADTGEQRNVEIEFEQYRNIWNEYTDTYLVDKYLIDLKRSMGIG